MRKVVLTTAGVALLASTGVTLAQGGFKRIREALSGFKEVPVISTTGSGSFTANINKEETQIEYELKYADLEGQITQAHIHFAAPNNTGPISVFLCSNLGNGPAGTQACPASPGSVEGVITAADVLGPAGQGIEPEALGELIAAIRAGVTYVNVHTTKWPAGEIRSQITHDEHHRSGRN
jgi:hypothetical protein